MSNKSKAKGTRAESSVVKFLKEYGWQARRKALAGTKDEGDIECSKDEKVWIALEVKSGKMTTNPNRTQIEEWLRQASVEQENSGQDCLLVIVRYNRKLKDADIYYCHDTGIREHMYLDELAERGWNKCQNEI